MIGYDQTLGDLRKIAEDKKAANDGVDYVYEKEGGRCLYAHEVKESLVPGCIIGALLNSVHGVSLEKMSEFESGGNSSFAADLLVGHLNLDFTPLAVALLSRVQEKQDQRVPWLEAVNLVAARVGAR